LITPDGSFTIQTTAPNVGQALAQTGLHLFVADFVAPPLETPVITDIEVNYRPAKDLTISTDGTLISLKSSQQTVGQALSSNGIALVGLDKSLPGESEPLPPDGQIKIIRIVETLTLSEKSIPFSNKIEYSLDLPAGEQKVLQLGEPGMTISRIRTRFEDGVKVASITEGETVVRLPKESIISLGSQIQLQTLKTPDGQLQYWRAIQMYATSYSPCRSGIQKCSYGTASGLPVKHGVVALVPALYNQLAGSQVYIPGYGLGVIGDTGGGFPDGRLWIDLGYSDDDYQSWSGMYTVYFLAPAPASIPTGLN
jgi:3D (Asp-Asp-Asp) domain-containing protein